MPAVDFGAAVFLHVPKTGGRSLRELVSAQIKPIPHARLQALGAHPFLTSVREVVGRREIHVVTRHPATWLESIWRFYGLVTHGWGRGWVATKRHVPVYPLTRDMTIRDLVALGQPSFTGFVESYLERYPGLATKVMQARVRSPLGDADVIGDYTNLGDCGRRLLLALGANAHFGKMPKMNASPGERPDWPAELLEAFMEHESTSP